MDKYVNISFFLFFREGTKKSSVNVKAVDFGFGLNFYLQTKG